MIATSIVELEILRLILPHMIDKDFLQMFFSGLFYSLIVAFIFGVWINRRLSSFKIKTDRDKVQNLIDVELSGFFYLFKNMPDSGYLVSMNLYCWEHIDQKIIFDVFNKKEIKIYFELYNYLDDMKEICLKLNELSHGASSALPNSKPIKQSYLGEFNRNKKSFLSCYRDNFK